MFLFFGIQTAKWMDNKDVPRSFAIGRFSFIHCWLSEYQKIILKKGHYYFDQILHRATLTMHRPLSTRVMQIPSDQNQHSPIEVLS